MRSTLFISTIVAAIAMVSTISAAPNRLPPTPMTLTRILRRFDKINPPKSTIPVDCPHEDHVFFKSMHTISMEASRLRSRLRAILPRLLPLHKGLPNPKILTHTQRAEQEVMRIREQLRHTEDHHPIATPKDGIIENLSRLWRYHKINGLDLQDNSHPVLEKCHDKNLMYLINTRQIAAAWVDLRSLAVRIETTIKNRSEEPARLSAFLRKEYTEDLASIVESMPAMCIDKSSRKQ